MSEDPRKRFARRCVAEVRCELQARGYEVSTMPHNAPYDLHATRGGETLRVEVKGSRRGRTGKWYANLRDNCADVLVLLCVSASTGHCVGTFVIPWPLVSGKRVLTIRRGDLASYRGIYAGYLEAWP